MNMWWLLAWLPDEALVLVVLGLGLALTLGLITGQAVLRTLGFLLLFPVIALFAGAILGNLPGWVSLLLAAAVGFSMLRFMAALLLGRRASDHMVGSLAAHTILSVFRLVFLPLRVIGAVMRATARKHLP